MMIFQKIKKNIAYHSHLDKHSAANSYSHKEVMC